MITYYIPFDKRLKSLPFHGSIHGFESRTEYHIKTFSTGLIPQMGGGLFGDPGRLRKDGMPVLLECIENVSIW